MEDQQEQGGGVRGRGCMQPRRRDCGCRLGIGCGRGGRGTFSQAMCGMGWERYLWNTQDQHTLNGPWQRKESNALNYFLLYFAIFIY